MSGEVLPHYDRKLVYVAGPYAHPDPVENTHIAIQVGERLLACGFITPFVPHLTLIWHMVKPHGVDHWYDFDLAFLARCDALLRFPGESSGADKEIVFAKRRNIPVFRNEGACIAWAQHSFDF